MKELEREELVDLIVRKSKSDDILYTLAISETEELKEIYYRLYGII